jgi:spermidine/putrescine transport system substrate-binding protein
MKTHHKNLQGQKVGGSILLIKTVQISRVSVLCFLLIALLVACSPKESLVTPSPESPPNKEELVFYNWEGDFPESVLTKFTQQYGIRVKYVAYTSQEDAIKKLRAGEDFDVVTFYNHFIPTLIKDGLLAELVHDRLPNLVNISPNFNNMHYDPGGLYTVPYQWGTTGLVVRNDLVKQPVTRWADLWDPQYTGKVGIWREEHREVLGMALKSLGYSINSENRDELEAALARLLALKPKAVFLDDYAAISSADMLGKGDIVVALGWAFDAIEGAEVNSAIDYVLPAEGAMIWGDNLVIPSNSKHKQNAELFINFILSPEINAEIVNNNFYATTNAAALPYILPEIQNNPMIFPSEESLVNAEVILPLSSEGEKISTEIWDRFLKSNP